MKDMLICTNPCLCPSCGHLLARRYGTIGRELIDRNGHVVDDTREESYIEILTCTNCGDSYPCEYIKDETNQVRYTTDLKLSQEIKEKAIEDTIYKKGLKLIHYNNPFYDKEC